MVAIENKIRIFKEETAESVNVIIEGSDEHLDKILAITTPLNSITEKFTVLNNTLYEELKDYPKDFIKDKVLPELMDINRLCLTYIGAIRTSAMYRDIRSALKKFNVQYSLLRETIHDLHHFIISDDHELDSLLKDIGDI